MQFPYKIRFKNETEINVEKNHHHDGEKTNTKIQLFPFI